MWLCLYNNGDSNIDGDGPSVVASFNDKKDVDRWFSGLDVNLKKDLFLRERTDLQYPYYIIRELNNPNVSQRYRIVTEADAEKFLMNFKRDKEWEKKVDESGEDDQYFYLGIIKWDGESYGISRDMKRLAGFDGAWYDHDHVTGWRLHRCHSAGFRNTYWTSDRLALFRKQRYLARRLKRMTNSEKKNAVLLDLKKEKLSRKIMRLEHKMHWQCEMRRHQHWKMTRGSRRFNPTWMKRLRRVSKSLRRNG